MFKKSEEHEWTRFRGALSKDREEQAPEAEASAAAAPAAPAPSSPAVRTAGDVNVTIPPRLPRSMGHDAQDVESLVSERTSFEGTLKCEGSVRVLGTVQGEVQSKGTIIVEERAHVTARLTATNVTIAGHVDGQVYCEGRVEIRPTGRVTGEISAGALVVHEGAFFEGSSRMLTPANQPAATDSAPTASTASPGSSASNASTASSAAAASTSAASNASPRAARETAPAQG
jgi:cytoskeletal protein CcmA (bactofilin family)